MSLKSSNTAITYITVIAIILFTTFAWTPLIPEIANNLKISNYAITQALSFYLILYGLGWFFFSIIIFRFSNTFLLKIALTIAFAGALGISVATKIGFFLFFFSITGFGLGGCALLVRHTLSEEYRGDELSRFMSISSTLLAMLKTMSFFLVIYTNYLFGWRGVFFLLSMIILFFIIFRLLQPESILKKSSSNISAKKILGIYKKLLTNLHFLSYPLCFSIAYTGFIIFFVSTPFIFHQYMNITQLQNALVLAFIMLGVFLGSILNLALKRVSPHKKLILASLLMLFSCIVLLILNNSEHGSILFIVLTFLFYTIGCQLIYPNSFSLGMDISKGLAEDTTIANVIYSALGTLFSGLITLSFFNTIEHSLNLVVVSMFICSTIILILSIILNFIKT